MSFFDRPTDRWGTRAPADLPPEQRTPHADGAPPRPRVIVRREPRRGSVAGWLLALLMGAGLAMLTVAMLQDPRSVGTQIDAAVDSVRDLGDRATQTVADSQQAAAEASRGVVDGVGTALDDAGISAQVKAALAVDPVLSAARIEVSTAGGIVRLDGPAPDAAAKERATVLAAAPPGVRGVDNRLALPAATQVVVAAAPSASQPAP